MPSEVTFIGLSIAALTVAFVHTIAGPDHYLPFIMISRARKWSLRKTILLTLGCGAGHVASSIVIGMIGILFGIVLNELQWLESIRGEMAARVLIIFGFVYMAWGLKNALRNLEHEHSHEHEGGTVHSHIHNHHKSHVHLHLDEKKNNITPWALFIIFVLGPCEPLIPLLMAPASQGDFALATWVALVFSAVTMLTMLGVVVFTYLGIRRIPLKGLERFSHVLAGGSILCCGMAIEFLGL